MWRTVKLGDVCDLIGGGTPSKRNADYYEGTIHWATVRDMAFSELYETEHKITDKGLKASSSKLIPKRNVIIASRVGLGKVCILQQDTAINQDLRGVIPKKDKEIDVKFLFYWFKSIAKDIISAGRGATVQGVTLPFLNSLLLPLPPIAEQQRIVAKLDAAFAEIDKAIEVTDSSYKHSDKLFLQLLAATFISNSGNWRTSKLGDVAEHRLGKMLDKKKNKGTFHKYLRNINVRWFRVNVEDMLEMKFEEHEKFTYSLNKGDLVICEGGYPGRAAVWEYDESVYIQKALHRVRFKESIFNRWLMYYLFYLDSTGTLSGYFTGSGIQHFTGQSLRKLPVPIPSVEEVTEFVNSFDKQMVEIVSLKTIYAKKIGELSGLKSAILAQELKGEAA